MDRRLRLVARLYIRCWMATVTLSLCTPALATPAIFTVHPQRVVSHIRAFARVSPVSRARVRAGLDGRLERLAVVPGCHVRAGQRIGDLGGSRVDARKARDRARMQAARSAEHDLRDALDIARDRLAQGLSTHQAVDRANEAFAWARARRVAAQQAWREDQALSELRAPASGAVVSVMAHAGERVRAGQALVLVQPDHDLMLTASVYAPDARRRLHAGMRGRFLPDDGSPAMAVRIAHLPPRLRPDGAQPVTLVPIRPLAPADAWVSGETGTVQLEEQPVKRILVPTRALILDRGRWWVLLHTARGDRRRAVVPGARHGDRTVIVDGLAPGMQVVVDHAYRRFHRGIAHHYQVQD